MIGRIGSLLFWMFSHYLLAQNYFDEIVPSSALNPNPHCLEKIDVDVYLITHIQLDSSLQLNASVLTSDFESTTELTFSSARLSPWSAETIDDGRYFYADPMGSDDEIRIIKTSLDVSEVNWDNVYQLDSGDVIANGMVALEDLYAITSEQNALTGFGGLKISKLNTEGEFLWQKTIIGDTHFVDSFEAKKTSNGEIVLSARVLAWGASERHARLLIINSEGEVVMEYIAERNCTSDYVTMAVELQDGNFMLAYQYNKWSNNDLSFPYDHDDVVTVFERINPLGNKISETYVTIPKPERRELIKLLKSNQDGFYGLGTRWKDENRVVELFKFNDLGELLWSRQYSRNDIVPPLDFYSGMDLLEEDNGDITILAGITNWIDSPQIWVFRVDSEGCYKEDCSNQLTLDIEHIDLETHLSIYPNPTHAHVKIEVPESLGSYSLKMYDLEGKVVIPTKFYYSSTTCNLSSLATGTYFLKICDEATSYCKTQKVFKY